MPAGSLFIGLMSGTSLDGVDAVLADCSSAPPRTGAHVHRAFGSELRAELTALCASGPDEIERAGVAARELAQLYAACIGDLLQTAGVDRASVRAIGAHGQTVRHRPHLGFSVQLNAPAWLAEHTGIDVVADFRNADIAAGGQGAPLASAFHRAAFSTSKPRAVVNIGGISNVTALPATSPGARNGGEQAIGFDCGPGNVLLDHWMQQHFAMPFDRDGAVAASAEVDEALLARMLEEPYFDDAPPKSTGRELFSPSWLTHATGGRRIDADSGAATLTRLTAVTIARAIERWFSQASDVVVCGGGADNPTLLRMLQLECAPRPVLASSALGVAPNQVEALAFAWLARAYVEGESGNVASVTGARAGRILGALYRAPAG